MAASGCLESLRLKNFLTYSDCYLNFEPGLNVIYGPNGTGKSSILCAILMVFGGNVKILNRSKSIYDYIKHNKNSAEIEVKINFENTQILIKRCIINDQTRKSLYFLNGKSQTEKQIIELASKMKINLGNMCNFLPQDRVNDFFKMNPQQLLVSLEQTIENEELKVIHDKLISAYFDKSEKQDLVKIKRKELENLEQRMKLIEEEVKKFENWKTNQQQIKYLEQKLYWTKYSEHREEYNMIKKKLVDAQKAYDHVCVSLCPQQNELKENQKNTQNSLKLIAKLESFLSEKIETVKSFKTSCNYQLNEVRKTRVSITEMHKNDLNNKMKLETAIAHKASLEQDYLGVENELQERMREVEGVDSQIENHMKVYSQIESETNNFIGELEKLEFKQKSLTNQLQSLKDIKHRLIEMVRQKDPDTFRAMEWIQDNKKVFKSTFLDPLLFQIDLYNSEDAIFLESHISRRDFFAFLSNNSDDLHLFLQQLREKMSLKTSCLLCSGEGENLASPDSSIYKRDYNFKGFMKDLFKCPKLVSSFLNESYSVHKIPIFNEMPESKIEALLKIADMKCFFTPKEKYIIKISRYTKNATVSSFLLKSNNKLLSKCISESELAALQNLANENLKKCLILKDKVSESKLKSEHIMKQVKDLNFQRKNLLSSKTKLKTIEAQIRSKTFECANITSLLEYSSEQLVKSNADIVDITQNCFLSCSDIITFIDQEFKTKFQQLLDERLSLIFLKQHNQIIENKLEGVNSLLQSQLEHLQSIKQEEIVKKEQTKQLFAKVQSMSGMSGKGGNSISQQLNEIFSQLPHEIEEINAKLAELQVINSTYVYFDHSIVDKHEEMKKKIANFSNYINQQNTVLESAENIEKSLKNEWISRIKQIIQIISDKFTTFFEKMKCQGRIELIEDPDGNYEKYALGLMVSYHPGEKLVQLKHNRHSGGEKAVAVMIFLMSIQQLSTSPFKMIDEINQGMDPINERTIFEIMVESISKTRSTNQYFFFSPKVLPDLAYSENVTIHTIFNGPEIFKELSTL